jgi:anti-anti-sigma factor
MNPRGAGDARPFPVPPAPRGRLSGGLSRTYRDRVDSGVRYQSTRATAGTLTAWDRWDVGVARARVPLAGGHMPDAVEPFHVEPFHAELLRMEVRYQHSDAFIVVEGAFDTTGAERFVASVVDALETHPEAIVVDALETHPEAVVVDAKGLTFIDSSGLAALLRSRVAAGAAGVGLRISDQSPALRRAISVAGLEDLLADV